MRWILMLAVCSLPAAAGISQGVLFVSATILASADVQVSEAGGYVTTTPGAEGSFTAEAIIDGEPVPLGPRWQSPAELISLAQMQRFDRLTLYAAR